MKTNSEGYVLPDGEGIIGVKSNCMFSNYQLDVYHSAVKKCKTKRRAIDIGAHLGVMSIRLAKEFDVVESFEPLFGEYLEINTKGKVNIHPYALGSKEKAKMTMRVGQYHSGMSNIVEDDVRETTQTYKDINLTTLDSFNFTDVDLIKIDAEYYEWPALKGAQKTIENNRPVIMIEVHNEYKDRNHIFTYLDSINYRYISDTKLEMVNSSLKDTGSDYIFWSNK